MNTSSRGYTLIELIVSLGIFAIVMLLATGAYLTMISVGRQAQGLATGADTLAFALETMTRTIRTGSEYSCNGGGNCSGGTSFSVMPSGGSSATTYALFGGAITQNGVAITDPAVAISSLVFYLSGSAAGDAFQPALTIIVSGSISAGPGKTLPFTVETGATMRGTDL